MPEVSRRQAGVDSKSAQANPLDLPKGNLIVFDGICILCSGFARFMTRRDTRAGFRFVDAHSDIGRALYRAHDLDPGLMETNIVLLDGRAYTKMASFTAAMRSLGWPWRMFAVLDLLPAAFANWIYDRIARNRYRLGQRACPLPSSDLKERLIADPPDRGPGFASAGSDVHKSELPDEATQPLFQRALGPRFEDLPEPVRALHAVSGSHRWVGEARVTRGSSVLSRVLCRMFGFPPAAERVPVSVTIERRGSRERWRRNFGGKAFETVLSLSGAPGSGHVRERFGVMAFDIPLVLEQGALAFPVSRAFFLGLPLPKWLLPVSKAKEFQAGQDFRFDILISVPGRGMLVHYEGFLQPAPPEAS